MEISDQHRAIVEAVKAVLYPWRRFTVSIDGVDHSGKSSLARFLAWQLGMPAIETDLFLAPSQDLPIYHSDMLRRAVSSRHNLNRPVIVEGIFVHKILKSIGVTADFSVYVECERYAGSNSWEDAFSQYRDQYRPRESAQFVFMHKGNNDS